MLNRIRTRRLLGFAALSATFSVVSLWACSVPVFRYALEHWPADPYQAVLFHRGPLSEAQQSLARELASDGMAGQLHANISLRMIDLDQNPAPDVLDFWRQLGADTVPWLVVRYPQAVRLPKNILSSPLNASAIQQVLDSPMRKEIVRRIARGESAVWVLLEIGDPKKDEAAVELIKSRLTYLTGVLELPALDEQDIVNGLISVGQENLKLEFSLLRLSRDNLPEKAFVKMLLGTESDLEDIQEPIVFPIFGRGRVLYALIGKGINHETIDEAASFLIGKCSCQVKELNPGIDLLFAATWDTSVKTQATAVRGSQPAAEQSKSAPVTVTISAREDRAAPLPPQGSRRFKRVGLVVLGGFALGWLVAACILLSKKN